MININIIHRSAQEESIKKYLNICAQSHAIHLFLYGPSGSEKSFCIQNILKDSGIKYIIVNCWEYSTRSAILSKICIDLGMPLPRKGVPSDFLFERLETYMKNKRTLIIVLDNIDKLSKKSEAIYDMVKLCEHNERLMIIAVAQNKEVLEGLVERVLSRLNPVRIEFPAYIKEQLFDILKNEIELKDNKPLEIIANYIAGRNGDCRIALECLKRISLSSENFSSNNIFKILNEVS